MTISNATSAGGLWFAEAVAPSDQYQHRLTKVLLEKRTKFQHLLIVQTTDYGKALILDGRWQSAVGDEFLYHEPLVHPACLCEGGPRSVLILGGGEGATLREVLRWKTVEKALMVDIDGEVVEACQQYLPEMHQGAFDDPRSEVIIADALEYLRTTENRFDVIIFDLSDPIDDGPSLELFTQQTFKTVHDVMGPNGTLVVQAGSVALMDMGLHVRLVQTLQTEFEHIASYASFVPTYAAPWGFVLAALTPIDMRPDPDTVDRILRSHLVDNARLRMFDGTTWSGMLQPPRHLREAVRHKIVQNPISTQAPSL